MTSIHKANKFKAIAEQEGWTVSILEEQGDEAHLTAVRGDEKIYIWWRDNTLIETPKYNYMGMESSLHNAATAARQLALKPDPERRIKGHKRKKMPDLREGDVIEEMLEKADLPFSIWEDTQVKILKSLRNCQLVVYRPLAQSTEVVGVPYIFNTNLSMYNLGQPGITHKPVKEVLDPKLGRPFVNFRSSVEFRSVYLDNILQVR